MSLISSLHAFILSMLEYIESARIDVVYMYIHILASNCCIYACMLWFAVVIRWHTTLIYICALCIWYIHM